MVRDRYHLPDVRSRTRIQFQEAHAGRRSSPDHNGQQIPGRIHPRLHHRHGNVLVHNGKHLPRRSALHVKHDGHHQIIRRDGPEEQALCPDSVRNHHHRRHDCHPADGPALLPCRIEQIRWRRDALQPRKTGIFPDSLVHRGHIPHPYRTEEIRQIHQRRDSPDCKHRTLSCNGCIRGRSGLFSSPRSLRHGFHSC